MWAYYILQMHSRTSLSCVAYAKAGKILSI